jgi:hypothetical protein
VLPRYSWEPAERRRQPVWLHDWAIAPPFDPHSQNELLRQLATLLAAR